MNGCKPKKSGIALDRMHRAKTAIHTGGVLSRPRMTFQRQQRGLDRAQMLTSIHDKVVQTIIYVA